MKLIVGLGNPGEKYSKTFHNVGFIYVDYLAECHNLEWKFEKKFNADIAKDADLILCKPQTFMNNSGEAVSKVVNYFDVDLDSVLVVHDDVDLPKETYKIQKGSGSAGHNGVSDIINLLNSKEFWRLRLGVGRPEDSRFDVKDYVLSTFDDSYLDFLKEIKLDF